MVLRKALDAGMRMALDLIHADCPLLLLAVHVGLQITECGINYIVVCLRELVI